MTELYDDGYRNIGPLSARTGRSVAATALNIAAESAIETFRATVTLATTRPASIADINEIAIPSTFLSHTPIGAYERELGCVTVRYGTREQPPARALHYTVNGPDGPLTPRRSGLCANE
jgi:hypothetical protein